MRFLQKEHRGMAQWHQPNPITNTIKARTNQIMVFFSLKDAAQIILLPGRSVQVLRHGWDVHKSNPIAIGHLNSNQAFS
jgi:hypothetical protein